MTKRLNKATGFAWTAPGLARIVGPMQNTAARTTGDLMLSRQIAVNVQQQGEKSGVIQKDMAHWKRLEL